MAPESLAGDIKFEHVNFRYGTRQRVLEDIDFTIKKGEKIAFVGESGSGKTTLSKLLLHLYQAESGNILINDNNIEDIQIETLRDKIAYIPQETFLFSGSIFENLTLGLDDATMDDIIEASKRRRHMNLLINCHSDMRQDWRKTEQTCQAVKGKGWL